MAAARTEVFLAGHLPWHALVRSRRSLFLFRFLLFFFAFFLVILSFFLLLFFPFCLRDIPLLVVFSVFPCIFFSSSHTLNIAVRSVLMSDSITLQRQDRLSCSGQ